MNIDFNHLPKDELLLDLKQYRQELVCAFAVIKSNNLEGEYLAAVKYLVKDLDIRRNILDCILTKKGGALGADVDDLTPSARVFFKNNFPSLISIEASKERLELKEEIRMLKAKNAKLESKIRVLA